MIANKYNNILFMFFSFILFLIAAFRPIGLDPDSSRYIHMIDKVVYFDWNNIELSFIWISKLISNFDEEIRNRLLFIIYAFLNIFFISISIKKYTKDINFALLVYLFLFYPILTLTQIRFGVAAAIIFWAIDDIVNKNFIKYVFKIFIASLFHFSALIFLPFYFIDTTKLQKLFYRKVLWFLFVIVIFFQSEFYLLMEYLVKNLLPEFLSVRIIAYFNWNFSNYHLITSFNMWLILLYLYLSIYINNLKTKYDIIMYKLLGGGLLLYFGLFSLAIFSDRILRVLGLVSIILFSKVLLNIKQKYLVLVLMIVVFYMVFYNITFRQGLLDYGLYFN